MSSKWYGFRSLVLGTHKSFVLGYFLHIPLTSATSTTTATTPPPPPPPKKNFLEQSLQWSMKLILPSPNPAAIFLSIVACCHDKHKHVTGRTFSNAFALFDKSSDDGSIFTMTAT